MGLLSNIWLGLKWFFHLIALPFHKISGPSARRWLLRVLHVVLIVGMLAGLGFLNAYLDLGSLLRVPAPFLRKVWLPLLFLLVYLLAWIAWWLWRWLSANPGETAFPDIDSAWQRAVAALEQAGLDLNRTPLFLLLGRPADGELNVFDAARMPLVQPPTPKTPAAPLRVAASTEGVYVLCSDVSLLTQYAALRAREADRRAHTGRAAVPPAATAQARPIASGGAAVEVTEDLLPPNRPAARERPGKSSREALAQAATALVQDVPASSSGPAPNAATKVPETPAGGVLLKPEVVQLAAARLRHLCRLIARQRRPYCPLNGILVLAPLSATDGDVQANEAALAVEHDLRIVHEELQVKCPVVVDVCDLETTTGAREFLERFPQQQRSRRLGIRFPHVADCDVASLPSMVDDGLAWVCQEMVTQLVYRLASAGGTPEDDPHSIRGNISLYYLLKELRDRRHRVVRMLQRGVLPDRPARWQLAGCYFSATGSDIHHEQAFVTDVFLQLHELQNWVSWTPQALAADRACRRAAAWGYVGLAVTIVSAFSLAWIL